MTHDTRLIQATQDTPGKLPVVPPHSPPHEFINQAAQMRLPAGAYTQSLGHTVFGGGVVLVYMLRPAVCGG